MAIVLGNFWTQCGYLVIGANFNGIANPSLTLILGMFVSGRRRSTTRVGTAAAAHGSGLHYPLSGY